MVLLRAEFGPVIIKMEPQVLIGNMNSQHSDPEMRILLIEIFCHLVHVAIHDPELFHPMTP